MNSFNMHSPVPILDTGANDVEYLSQCPFPLKMETSNTNDVMHSQEVIAVPSLPALHIEILLNSSSAVVPENVEKMVYNFLVSRNNPISSSGFSATQLEGSLHSHIKELRICDDDTEIHKEGIDMGKYTLKYHVYKLNKDGPGSEDLEGEDLSAANHWVLPSSEFHGLWESLFYDSTIKNQLMNFVMTTILFSDHHVDSNVISWNRVVLLHGPPGTGKTSLCKALSQKLSIRLSHKFKYGQLIEINSHSLFSKWFSESGKLVMKMFQKIQELINDPECLVFVLIDEVESLAHARSASLGGTEPSDAIRVVNALLTQIDQIRRYPNVIILTTSNMTEAIDLAFVDRADIKFYVGTPSAQAIYQILHSCIRELQEKKMAYPKQSLQHWPVRIPTASDGEIAHLSYQLLKVTKSCEGLSGRTLKKLPFLAHALFLQTPQFTVAALIEALERAVKQHLTDEDKLKVNSFKCAKTENQE